MEIELNYEDFLAEKIKNNISYAEYLSNMVNKSKSYAEEMKELRLKKLKRILDE